MVSEETQGIRVSVESFYLADQSLPDEERWAFAYRINIANASSRRARLLRRHWLITDERGRVTEVRGDGVVGEQPILEPGTEHVYTSGAVLETPSGTMEGSYEMQDADGRLFEVRIPRFALGRPELLH